MLHTFLPKKSMCGAQLCVHSPCPHPIALRVRVRPHCPGHPTPPHPTPDLVPLSSSSSSCFNPHCTSSTCFRLHTIDPLNSPESRSSSTMMIQLVNRFNSCTIQLMNDSTRTSFSVHMILSVQASSAHCALQAILDNTRSKVGPTPCPANAST